MTIVRPRNNDLIALRDTVSFGFVMSLRSHLFFERDSANLAREKINAELTVQLSHFHITENRKLLT